MQQEARGPPAITALIGEFGVPIFRSTQNSACLHLTHYLRSSVVPSAGHSQWP